MSYRTELREVKVLYCDHCGEEGKLPAMTINGKTYADCCRIAGWKEYSLSTIIGQGHQALRPLLPYEDIA